MKKSYIKQYIEKNKSIKITRENFNEIDAAILSTLCLIDVNNCIPKEGSKKVTTFKSAIDEHIKIHNKTKLGLILPMSVTKGLTQASLTDRFGSLTIHDLHQDLSDKLITQSTFFIADIDETTKIIIFGSTDDSINGWLENADLLITNEPTCAKEALEFVNKHFDKKCKYFFVGHSKGGFECAYTYFKTKKEIRNAIIKAYDFDGPGFSLDFVKNLKDDSNKFELICPQSSYVGRLFHQPVKHRIVKSKQYGVAQHNPNNWQIENDHFVNAPEFSRISTKRINAINNYFENLSYENKKEIIATLNKVLSSLDEKTLTQVSKKPFKLIKKINKLSHLEKNNFRKVGRGILKNYLNQNKNS